MSRRSDTASRCWGDPKYSQLYHLLQDLDLVDERQLVLDFALPDDFDRPLRPGAFVRAYHHFAIGAFADDFLGVEVVGVGDLGPFVRDQPGPLQVDIVLLH